MNFKVVRKFKNLIYPHLIKKKLINKDCYFIISIILMIIIIIYYCYYYYYNLIILFKKNENIHIFEKFSIFLVNRRLFKSRIIFGNFIIYKFLIF